MATVSAWCIAFFFLLHGIGAFAPPLNTDTFKKVIQGVALVAGITSVLNLIGM
jgi:hypothetical protein